MTTIAEITIGSEKKAGDDNALFHVLAAASLATSIPFVVALCTLGPILLGSKRRVEHGGACGVALHIVAFATIIDWLSAFGQAYVSVVTKDASLSPNNKSRA